MAAMAAYEVVKAVQVSLTGGQSGGYRRLSQDGFDDSGTEIEMTDAVAETSSPHRRRRSGSESSSPKQQVVTTKRATVVLHSGFVHVIITIIKRLGLPFFMLKALGWAIFFIVWYMNSGAGTLDVKSLSSTLRSNMPLVESALQTSLPAAVGVCEHFRNVTNMTTRSCVDKQFLHYEKNSAYEVLARWLSGFDGVKLTDMYIAVPVRNKLSLNVKGIFDSVKLSLFIGQCLGGWFSSEEEAETVRPIPRCSSVFDEIHEWRNITWSIEVEADCAAASPYVRNIVVDEIALDSQMKIEQEIGWGLSVPLDDLGDKFKQGIRDSIQPLLAKKEEWIPWGPKQYDLTTLLSKLVELNADSLGGSLEFTCPKPQS
jgi:hypothetical protein